MLNVSNYIQESIVDGPGIRFTLFLQGCPHNCKGCHNPQTHSFNINKLMSKESIFALINNNPLLSGITISGGEPFCQTKDVYELICYIQEHITNKSLTYMCYTGYKWEQLINSTDNYTHKILEKIDYLVDEPFILSLRTLDLPFRGSTNQNFIDVQKSLKTGKKEVI